MKEQQEEAPSGKKTKTYDPDHWIDIEEIDAILARTYHANKHEKGATKQWRTTKKCDLGRQCAALCTCKGSFQRGISAGGRL